MAGTGMLGVLLNAFGLLVACLSGGLADGATGNISSVDDKSEACPTRKQNTDSTLTVCNVQVFIFTASSSEYLKGKSETKKMKFPPFKQVQSGPGQEKHKKLHRKWIRNMLLDITGQFLPFYHFPRGCP